MVKNKKVKLRLFTGTWTANFLASFSGSGTRSVSNSGRGYIKLYAWSQSGMSSWSWSIHVVSREGHMCTVREREREREYEA